MVRGARDGVLQLGPLVDVLATVLMFLVGTTSLAPHARLVVRQAGSDCGSTRPPPPRAELVLRVGDLQFGGGAERIAHVRDAHGRLRTTALVTALVVAKQAHPEREGIVIFTEDEVAYDDLIRVVDAVKPYFAEVTISPAGV